MIQSAQVEMVPIYRVRGDQGVCFIYLSKKLLFLFREIVFAFAIILKLLIY